MASIIGKIIYIGVKLTGLVTKTLPLSLVRYSQDVLGIIGRNGSKRFCNFETITINEKKHFFVSPKDADKHNVGKIILYIHGGGYVAGDSPYVKMVAAYLCNNLKFKVFGCVYGLAPENKFPTAVNDALDCYEYLLESGYSPDDIILAGESAGGGLEYSLCLSLIERNMQVPKMIIAMSPWTDLTLSLPSHKYNKHKDPTLSARSLRKNAISYAGDNIDVPGVSPIFAGKDMLSKMPPSIIFVCTNELLLDDSVKMDSVLKQAGAKSTLHIYDGLWHAFSLFELPEARDSLKKMREFISENE